MTAPTELCQLVANWDRKPVPVGGVIADVKIDGWRAPCFRGRQGTPKLWTRGGFEIHGVDHILLRLAVMERIAGEPMMFDGEFQVGGTLKATKVWCESGWKFGGNAGLYHIFDCMTQAEFNSGRCDMPIEDRKRRLFDLIAAMEAEMQASFEYEGDPTPIRGIWGKILYTRSCVIEEAQKVWDAGGEGLVLKIPGTAYRRNRNQNWMKVKK